MLHSPFRCAVSGARWGTSAPSWQAPHTTCVTATSLPACLFASTGTPSVHWPSFPPSPSSRVSGNRCVMLVKPKRCNNTSDVCSLKETTQKSSPESPWQGKKGGSANPTYVCKIHCIHTFFIFPSIWNLESSVVRGFQGFSKSLLRRTQRVHSVLFCC